MTPDDTWEITREEKPWWAEYGGVIRTAFAMTAIIVASYVAVHRGWLP